MNSYTSNIALAYPSLSDTGWAPTIDNNFVLMDSQNAIGAIGVSLTEQPSASLNVKVAAGSYIKQDGTVGTYAGTSSQSITASTTKVLYLDLTASGALTVAASFPSTAHVRIATVVSGSTTITSIADARLPFEACGSYLDGVNFSFGTTTGTQIGTSTSQKIGFYGKTPVIQQTGGAATAGATYTSAEQAMLNAAYAALRTMGLLS